MVRFARLPLSPYQRDIWVAAAQFPELDQYTIFSYDRFTGEVDTQALERALLQAARDTEAFRLRLGETDGTPYQWLDADAEFEARHVDLRADRDPEAAVRSWLRDAFRHAYPLDGRSLVDLALLHSDQALYVYVRTHHIVSDAWGLQLFLSRVRAGYLGELGEPQAQMPTASLLAQLETDDYSGSEQYRGDRAYFAEALEGLEPALFTRRRPAGLRRTARHRLTLERTLLDAIRDRGESPFLFLSAAVALYLARIHQNDDVVLGVPVLNRADRAAKQVVGHFANTLPLRIRTAPEQTVDEFLAQLREATRTLLRHQKMPLGDLLRGASPLFDTTLSYMRWPAAQAIPNASVETVAQTHAHDPDALAIWVSEFDGHSDAQVDFEYACDVFDADFPMDAAARHIETFLRALVEGGERRLGELDPLSAAEREELIHTRNATDQAFPEQATLPTLFAEQVARTPQRTALLEADGGTLSYAELDAKVQAVADALRAAGVRTDERVALLVARGPHLLPAILGVQRAGGAYVPINPDHPLERVRLLLEDCGARVVLVDERAATLGESLGETRVLHLERLPQSTGDLPAANVAPGDLAYVIYTSGSTGMPKGVMVEHRSVVNRLNWMQRRYPIGERDVLLQKTPVTFDVSVWELFWWSFTGARLSLLPPGAEKDPREMLRSIQRDAVTVIHFVPSMLTPFLDLLDGDPTARAAASSLRLVFCSGEALAPLQVARFRRLFGDAVRLVNLYGPTEATVDVSDHECASDNPTRVPIGRPIDNLRLYVLDHALRPQPLGAVGELYRRRRRRPRLPEPAGAERRALPRRPLRRRRPSLPYRRPGPLAGRRQPRIPRPRRRPGEDPRQPGRTRRSTRPPRRASRRTRRRGRGTRFGGTRHAPGRLLRGCGGTRPRSIARRTFGDAAGLHAASLLRAHRQPPAQRQRQARPPATAGTAGTGGGGCAAHGDRGRTGGGVGRCPRRGGGRRARRLLRPRRRLDPDAAHPRRRTAARPGLRTRRPDAQPDGGGPRRTPGASARGAKLPALRTGFRSRQAAPGRAGGRLPDQPAESRPALP
ncbi:AMP-binding protein [Pseudomonas aeruginosa]|nr:AMP-binding protein [Pseudomonas aeruginosa]